MKKRTKEDLKLYLSLFMFLIMSIIGWYLSKILFLKMGINPHEPIIFIIAWNSGWMLIVLRILGKFNVRNKEEEIKKPKHKMIKRKPRNEYEFRKLTKEDKKRIEKLRKWGTLILLVVVLLLMMQTLLQMLECSKALEYVGDPTVCKMCDILIDSGAIVDAPISNMPYRNPDLGGYSK